MIPRPEPEQVDLVLYHASCGDGLGAAWAAHKRLGEKAEYVPVQYGDPVPDSIDGKHIAVVDFSFKPAQIDAIMSRAASLILLDHHKSAAENLKGHPNAIFNMDKSGAMLAWEWFHPGVPAPPLIEYVQDRDLWRWELPDSKAVSAALMLYSFDFDGWEEANRHLECDPSEGRRETLLDKGYAILEYNNKVTTRRAKHAVKAVLPYPEYIRKNAKGDVVEHYPAGELPILLLNGKISCSEVAHAMLGLPECEGRAACIWFYDHEDDMARLELRSKEGHPAVDRVAKAWGGGGHRNAAGFEFRHDAPSRRNPLPVRVETGSGP